MPKARAWAIPLLLLLSVLAVAQTSTSSLSGTITDPKGAVIAGAEVTLTNPATGYKVSGKTERDGVYRFVQLRPGTYDVEVSASGFTTHKHAGVPLLVSTANTLNISMKIAGGETVVEVHGELPLVNTQDASLGHAFDTSQIASLPFEGRNPVEILSLQPGVTFLGRNVNDEVSQSRDFDSRSGAVNGARSDQTNVTLDGIDNNDQLRGYAFTGTLRATLDSVQEFRVTTSNANADSGRSSGAQVTLITKSGTNAFHGTAFEYYRPPFGSANDWFNKHAEQTAGEPNIPGKILRNTFGAAIGGPIQKDRLFFFFNYEGQRSRESQQVTRVVPSDNLRNGIISYQCDIGPLNCPASGIMTLTQNQLAQLDPNCFGNGTCPYGSPGLGGANPAVMALWQSAYPHPNTDTVGDGLNYRGFTFSSPAPADLNTYILKLDYNLTADGKHRLFVRGNLQNDGRTTPPQFPGLPANDFITGNNKGIGAGYTATLSDRLINNFRYGFIRQGIGDSGLQTSHFVHFRGLDDPQGFTPSTYATVPVHNFVDDVSWVHGKHTIQFGANWRLIHNDRMSNAQSFFENVTNSSWTSTSGFANRGTSLDPGASQFAALNLPAVSSGFANSWNFPVTALTGLLVQQDSVYNQLKSGALPEGTLVPRHYKANEFEMYVQDSWRIKPNFTITAGLRWSLLQPPYEVNGNQVAPSISLSDWFNKRQAAMLAGQTYHQTISLDFAGQANGKAPMWAWDYRDFAPRFSFAWSPDWDSGFLKKVFGGRDRSSIRGGYSMVYDHFGEGVVNTFDRQGAFGLTTTILNAAGIQTADCVPRFVSLTTMAGNDCTGTPLIAPPPGPIPVTPPTGFDNGSFAIYWGLDDKLKTPYAHTFDLSFTRELPGHFVLETSYVGRLGHRLLQEADLAMPLDIVDPASKVDYFTAASQLSILAEANTPITAVQNIGYWQNLFPGASGGGLLSGVNPVTGKPDGTYTCAPPGTYVQGSGAPLTATQNMYDNYFCNLHNETTALVIADLGCYPACSSVTGGNPFAYFDDQFSSLYAWRSIGSSSYNAAQVTLRRHYGSVQFDLNYTYSKSIDIGSNAERINSFEFGPVNANNNAAFNSQVINSWFPTQLRSVSDWDTTHQFNANWAIDLPFGKGRHWDLSGVANAIAGGWMVSGLYRWTSGLPFSVSSGANWSTNWELSGNGVLVGQPPVTGAFVDSTGDMNLFANNTTARDAFRFAHPGESGNRNLLRGPGYFGVDLGISKTWNLTERQSLKFGYEIFNLTNSVRFDVASVAPNLDQSTTFGKYNTTLSTPRVMQFSLRYSF